MALWRSILSQFVSIYFMRRVIVLPVVQSSANSEKIFERHHEKTSLRGLQPCYLHNPLLSYIDNLGSWNFIYVTSTANILSRQRTIKALIRLRGRADWSAPLLFACIKQIFSWHGCFVIAQLICLYICVLLPNYCLFDVKSRHHTCMIAIIWVIMLKLVPGISYNIFPQEQIHIMIIGMHPRETEAELFIIKVKIEYMPK